MRFDPKVLQDSMQELLEMLAKGSLHVHISHKFGLSEVINYLLFSFEYLQFLFTETRTINPFLLK